MKKILVFTLLLFTVSTAHAVDVQPRLITVTGEGEVMAVPDEVWVNFQMESFHENLAEAKKTNDEAIKQALAIVKKYKVDDKDFMTDYFTVRNEDRYFMDPQTNQQRSKRGFFVTKNVSVILRDVSKFEDLYSDVLEAGVNNITGVEFKSSEVKKYREQARTMAIQVAKDKAQKMTAELGQALGRPYTIQENATDWNGPRPMMAMAMLKDSAGSGNATIALGQVKITSSVTVSFELT